MGNLGLWDREHSDSRYNQSFKPWLYRASGTSLGATVYSRIWWRSVKSDDVRGVASSVTRILAVLTSFSWGQSAGSMSVSLQMVTNGGNTEGLFRAAFMQSGSPIPTSDITDVSVPMHTVILPNC